MSSPLRARLESISWYQSLFCIATFLIHLLNRLRSPQVMEGRIYIGHSGMILNRLCIRFKRITFLTVLLVIED